MDSTTPDLAAEAPDPGARLRAALGWSAVYLVSQANIARLLGPAAPKLGRMQTAPSAAAYRGVLASMTPRELDGYRVHYRLDMVHPLIYAAALRAGARLLDARRPRSVRMRRLLAAAPVASAAGDYIENVAGWYLLDHREHITDLRIRTMTAVSVTKWVLALGQTGYLAVGLARTVGTADRR